VIPSAKYSSFISWVVRSRNGSTATDFGGAGAAWPSVLVVMGRNTTIPTIATHTATTPPMSADRFREAVAGWPPTVEVLPGAVSVVIALPADMPGAASAPVQRLTGAIMRYPSRGTVAI